MGRDIWQYSWEMALCLETPDQIVPLETHIWIISGYYFRMPEKSVFLGYRKWRPPFMSVRSLAWFSLILNPYLQMPISVLVSAYECTVSKFFLPGHIQDSVINSLFKNVTTFRFSTRNFTTLFSAHYSTVMWRILWGTAHIFEQASELCNIQWEKKFCKIKSSKLWAYIIDMLVSKYIFSTLPLGSI